MKHPTKKSKPNPLGPITACSIIRYITIDHSHEHHIGHSKISRRSIQALLNHLERLQIDPRFTIVSCHYTNIQRNAFASI